jgi:hypothetical protein
MIDGFKKMRKSFILLFILAAISALPLLAVPDKSMKINSLMTEYHNNGLFDGVVLVSEIIQRL